MIGDAIGESPAAVRERIPFIFSGGVEGVLSPHYVVFIAAAGAAPATGTALAVGVAFTPPLNPRDIGRQRQMDRTAAAVADAMAAADIADPADVHLVQIEGPAFPLADIAASQRAGFAPASDNPGKLMGLGRAASALGVGKALGEIPAERSVGSGALLKDCGAFSSVASCSARIEVSANEVVVIGMSDKWSGTLAVAHAPLADALDVLGIGCALRDLGFEAPGELSADEAARLRAAFVKCEASRDGLVRGKPHTMLNDGDIDQQRHIRGAVGAIGASVLNDTALFVSGGAEHQGPDGGGLIAIITDRGA
jgi:cyanuric acid amidohydrolase